MNRLRKNLVTLILAVVTLNVFAQDKGSVPDLIKEGVQLNDQGKYADAIAKYSEALKLEPENAQANYEMGFTLVQSGKGIDGIPFVEKAIEKNNSLQLKAACYDMLGSIYDNDHQTQKAIEAYKNGIQVNPKYQQLYYNLGLTYFRNKQFADAEANAIEAIKLDPKHASSLRMYALVTFHQNKRVNALMGFCSFLLLNPQGPQAAEAFGNIQHILQGGVLKDASGKSTIILSPKDNQENATMNLAISMSVLAGQNKKLSGLDLLEFELKSIFTIAGETSEKKTDKDFYDKFFVDYFYKLSKSDNMPAFTRLVSLSANKDANTKWMSEHDDLVKALDNWLATTDRSF
ncbi:MAG TPA: tetratricopeptide repeat protein [Mucilaginibacter sp.]|nr:tetratricopeptide repeat protein [Mucilaginibacter sp.]